MGKQARILLMSRYLEAARVLVTEVLYEATPLERKWRQMVSERLRVRLEQREAVLRILDRRRTQTGDPNLGWGMEKKILDLELADLETTMGIQESTERTVIQSIRPIRTDT